MPYKIAVTVTNDLNQDQRMHRICQSLMEAGYDVIFLGRLKKSSTDLLNHEFNQKRLKCWFESGVFFYFEFNIRLLLFLLNYKADIIYSVDLDTLLAGGILSRLQKNKLIYDAHEYFVEVPELENATIKKKIWNLIANRFIPRSSLNITVNVELAEVLREKYKSKFKVIRSVPNLEPLDYDYSSDKEKILLYQGVLNKGRGLEEIIKWISKKEEDILLYIVGEGDLSNSLRALKKEVDVNNKVQFLGWKSPQELDEISKSAWLGINLLDGKSLNYKYSLANKFFNYMHAGIPSLNMDFPTYIRYCKKDNIGICIPDLNDETLDLAIIPLLKDLEKYQEMVRATQTAKKKYSWQNEKIKLVSFVDEIIK